MKSTRVAPSPAEKRGAKPGEKRGGKPPGTKDRATVERENKIADAMKAASEAIGDAVLESMSPKDVLLFVMRLAAKQGWWFKAAEVATQVAPYIHAKLASTEIDDKRRRVPEEFDDAELEALARANIMIPGVAERDEESVAN